MASKIKHKRSSVAGRIPVAGDLEAGELALNTNDGKVFLKKDDDSIVDITSTIFKNDTNVTVTDTGSNGEMSVVVDNIEQLRVTATGIELNEDTSLQNASGLQFKELASNGSSHVELKAPDNLPSSYSLKLPLQTGTTNQTLITDGLGNLSFADADVFGGNRVYVSNTKGNDANDGITAPVQTIKRALQIASSIVYTPLGVLTGTKIVVQVSAGEYVENNPIIVPDNVSVIGDGLRACILRPLNANKDMLRVRNACYFTEFTFRDGITAGEPTYTWDYAVSFDDPLDSTTSRVGYTNLPATKPIIATSPYIQNCSIISFLGGNGVLIDGNKVDTPNRPEFDIEAENPVVGAIPEQGKSMVSNAFTMLSFGGTGWRIINEAYAQIVSCFQIFMLNGVYTQSGGYCSITNSATNFGLYALRASGYSPNSFAFDRGYVGAVGANGTVQNLTVFGFERPEGPVEEFVIRLYDPITDADITSDYKTPLTSFLETTFNAATAPDVASNIFTITAHGFNNADEVTYSSNGNTNIGGLFSGDTYFIKYLTADTFIICYDDSLTREVNVTALSTGTHNFTKQDYQLFVKEINETHNTFQDLELPAGSYTFTAGDIITGTTIGLPNNAYVYAFDSGTNILTVAVNKVTIGTSQVRNVFAAGSTITTLNGAGVSYGVVSTAARTDLWAATFDIEPTITGGQLTDVANIPKKKLHFHRPSVTNSSSHTWEYAGSGTDYNALPQNGGQTIVKYEQYREGAGRVYTSGTNELGDFKVGDFITAYNRTGNITFRNKVTVDTLDVLRLALSDIEITGISTDVDLGENEAGGPSNARLSTQLSMWSYANNRLGPFIDKSVTTSAIPGSIVQLNSNGQINSDLIPSQRSFTSFVSGGYRSRLTQVDNVPAGDMQSGDIATENFEQVELTLNSGLAAAFNDGDLVVQANTGAQAYLKGDYTIGATSIIVASTFATFNASFTTGASNTLTIAGTATGKYPTLVGTEDTSSSNYFLRGATSGQYLLLPNGSSHVFTNTTVSKAFRYNNTAYVTTTAAHNLLTGNQVKVDAGTVSFDAIPFIDVLSSTEFYYDNIAADSSTSATTSATATLAGATSATTMTGSIATAGLTGTITIGDYIFDVSGTIPQGSKITAVNMGVNPRTFTVTFPTASTVPSTTIAQLKFFTPAVETGTVRSVITAADSLSQGVFSEQRSGVLATVNNLGLTGGSGYVPGIYQRVPLTNVSGSGTSGLADIIVGSSGAVTDVDLVFGGTGYAAGNVLSASNSNLGGTGSGFQITVTSAETRVYVDITGGQLFVATSTAPDFAEDNAATRITIVATDSNTETFNAAPTGGGGDVDYTTNYITITGHNFTNGDAIRYDPSPNASMGGLTAGNTYYVKVVNANTIQLCATYNVASVSALALGPSSTGTHSLINDSVNIVDNSFHAPGHGLMTGEAVRVSGDNLFSVGGSVVPDNTRYFAGSITVDTFTLHELRADALLSVAGNVTNSVNITAKGTGNITFVHNAVQINGTVNTSSRVVTNWNSLVSTNIDATNIISGIIATSRLASGSASTDTFLRGDSQWATAVKSVAANAGSPLSVLGSGSSPFYGDIILDIEKVNRVGGANDFSTIGAAGFLTTQFYVGTDSTSDKGLVYIKDGVVDAGTLDTYDSSYYLNPSNLTSNVPVNRGGTALSLYAVGDMIYATAATTLNKVSIGNANTVMTSTGTAPQWSSSLTMAGNVSVNSGEIATTSTTTANVFNTAATAINIGGAATSVTIGNSATESLTTRVASYTAATSTTVTVNLVAVTNANNLATANGVTEIKFSNTVGAKVGMVVSGTASIPANTTIVGLTGTSIYLSAATVGTITAATTLTFTETPTSLGVQVGDKITIASSLVTNLDGTWPVSAAGASSTSFSIITTSAVTASAVARAGTIIRSSDTLIKTRSLTIGSTGEQVTTPTSATIKAGDAVGTNIAGADLYIRSGNNTGNNVIGGYVYIQTPTSTGSGAAQQPATTRVTIAPNGTVTFANNVVASLDLAVNGGDLTTSATTFNLLNTDATTLNIGGAATTVSIGAATGTATINNANTVVTGDLAVNGADITTTATGTATVFNTNATTVNAFGAATALTIGATTGTATIRNATVAVTNAATVGTTLTVNHSIAATAEVTGITTTATPVDSWDYATYRSAKYQVQVTCTASTGANANTYQVSEILVIHNGTTATMTEYGVARTGAAELATFTVDISGANARLLATAPAGDTIKVKVHRVALTA